MGQTELEPNVGSCHSGSHCAYIKTVFKSEVNICLRVSSSADMCTELNEIKEIKIKTYECAAADLCTELKSVKEIETDTKTAAGKCTEADLIEKVDSKSGNYAELDRVLRILNTAVQAELAVYRSSSCRTDLCAEADTVVEVETESDTGKSLCKSLSVEKLEQTGIRTGVSTGEETKTKVFVVKAVEHKTGVCIRTCKCAYQIRNFCTDTCTESEGKTEIKVTQHFVRDGRTEFKSGDIFVINEIIDGINRIYYYYHLRLVGICGTHHEDDCK